MQKKSQIEILDKYKFIEDLKKLKFIEAIYVYGSRARGDADERSDIDLAIVCPKATTGDWEKVMSLIDQADTLLQIDCVRLDDIKNDELLLEINKSKIILFRRGVKL